MRRTTDQIDISLTPPGRPCLLPGFLAGMGVAIAHDLYCSLCSRVGLPPSFVKQQLPRCLQTLRFPPTFENRYWPANQDRQGSLYYIRIRIFIFRSRHGLELDEKDNRNPRPQYINCRELTINPAASIVTLRSPSAASFAKVRANHSQHSIGQGRM